MGLILKDIFSRIVNQVLFGAKDLPLVEGLQVPAAVEKILHLCFYEVRKNPWNLMLGGIPAKKNWL